MKKLPIYRIILIIWMAIKFFTQVILFKKRYNGKWTKEVETKWESLVTKQAREYKELALKLEGLMIKLGQFLSTRADIMPKSFLKELDDLTDRVPSVPWEKAKKVLEDEWKQPYGGYLHKISIEPIASASIGEVYHGYLHNGDSVAIKIQRPGIEQIIQTDFKAIRIVLWLADKFTSFGQQTDLSLLYREMTNTIGDELNFRKELQNGQTFFKRFENIDFVTVPLYYEEYTTRRVLVMEWIEGSKITDISFIEKNQLDRKQLAKRLLEIFLEQLLKEGLFHADPHGGNILLKPDGTIVLIDFGMVGRISKRDADAVQEAVEGIIFQQFDDVVNALEKLRFLLPHANKQLLADMIRQLVDVYKSQEFQKADSYVIEQLLRDIQDLVQKEPIQMPSEFAFFGRAISTFTGVIYILDPKADLLEMSKPIIMDWVKVRSEESGSPIWKVLQRYLQPLLHLPTALQEAAQEPRRYREWRQKNVLIERQYQSLLAQRRDTVFFVAIPFISLNVSLFLEKWMISYITGALTFIGFFMYFRASWKLRKLQEEE